MNRTLEQSTILLLQDLKFLKIYYDGDAIAQSITKISKTTLGDRITWFTIDNEADLSNKKWSQLLAIAIDLVTFFLTNFLSGDRIIAPKWWKIGFWAKVGKFVFQKVRQVIKILRKNPSKAMV